jgi:hypothetical protein
MSDPSGGFTMVADPKKAVGGHVLAHAATTRITLRKVRHHFMQSKEQETGSFLVLLFSSCSFFQLLFFVLVLVYLPSYLFAPQRFTQMFTKADIFEI